jgi:hypothetical protein
VITIEPTSATVLLAFVKISIFLQLCEAEHHNMQSRVA